MQELHCDIAIFGGGIAGLWVLDELRRRGWNCVLLEKNALGAGQTVWSQGILHGGAKYTLRGLGDKLAGITQVIARMPEIWRAGLAGEGEPDLSAARIRAPHCYLWRTETLKSRFSLVGATMALRTRPEKLARENCPSILKDVPGEIFQINEQVIEPASVLSAFAKRNADSLMHFDRLEVAQSQPAPEFVIHRGENQCRVHAKRVILAAGNGNGALREAFGLGAKAMQVRPLHMILARGAGLPELNGHCIDGAKTRVTITTDRDSAGRTIWQIGGQVAEDGTSMTSREVIEHTKKELRFSIPNIDLAGTEWTTHEAPRAEAAAGQGLRPDDVAVIEDGAIVTTWPTKLVLAPRVAERLVELLGEAPQRDPEPIDWPRPSVALPPWEAPREWID